MSRIVEITEKVWIPEVSRNDIERLAKIIRPIIRNHQDGQAYYIKSVDLFETAYTWDPKITKIAIGIKPIVDITTYHTYGYYGFFKPSVAEVLAQIPAEHLNKVVAFEIIGSPETAEDMNEEHAALNAGYHVATTRLYSL
jgi:hypothetical protein